MFDIIHAFLGTTALNATTSHDNNSDFEIKVKFRARRTTEDHPGTAAEQTATPRVDPDMPVIL